MDDVVGDGIDTDDVEAYLGKIGDVVVVHRGHDSNNTSAVVAVDGVRWFVKWATDPVSVAHLESAVRFHAAVTHPAIAAMEGWFRTPSGMAVVHEWAPGEIINDPLAPGGLPRSHPDSAYARFRRLPVGELVAAVDTVLEVHLAVARRGFVAVDFYDGCLIYDFQRRSLKLCDLDMYRPGPYELDRDRQYGSTRFMAPEEFRRGATIDERTTVYTLGRTAFVLLSRGERGEEEHSRWRAGVGLYDVARTATRREPRDRYPSVAELARAWRAAVRGMSVPGD
jgi:serine/threonine protein kinase